MKKAIVYIDGFNLYYGIKSLKDAKLKWLNIQELSESFVDSDTELVGVKYFTSTIKGNDKSKCIHQKIYLDALSTLDKTSIIKGHFFSKGFNCRKCNHYNQTFEEKKTDVSIACELLADTYEDKFDVAFVVSGDSDLVPPVEKAREKGKTIIVAFPPNRKSVELKKVATNSFNINTKRLKQNLFPMEITTKKGKKLSCPEAWR